MHYINEICCIKLGPKVPNCFHDKQQLYSLHQLSDYHDVIWWLTEIQIWFNTFKPEQNGWHFVEDIFNAFSWMKIILFWLNTEV